MIKDICLAIKYKMPVGVILKYALHASIFYAVALLVVIFSIHIITLHYIGLGFSALSDVFNRINMTIREYLGVGSAFIDRLGNNMAQAYRPLSKEFRNRRVTNKYEKNVERDEKRKKQIGPVLKKIEEDNQNG